MAAQAQAAAAAQTAAATPTQTPLAYDCRAPHSRGSAEVGREG